MVYWINKTLSGISAVFFDHDETLVFTEKIHFEAWKQILENYEFFLTRTVYSRDFRAQTGAHVVSHFLTQYFSKSMAEKIYKQKKNLYQKMIFQNLEMVMGAEDFLIELKKMKIVLGMITSSSRQALEGASQLFRYDLFFNKTNIVTGEDVTFPKPHSEPFLKLLDLNQVLPGQTVYIGDSEKDMVGAKKVGMKTLGITTAHSEEELKNFGADMVMNNFRDLKILRDSDQTIKIIKKD